MAKNRRNTGMVYSTNRDLDLNQDFEHEEETLPVEEQLLYISLDRKMRKGKVVTLIQNFVGSTDDLSDLGKKLKSRCGTGGTVKNGEIILQGDFKIKMNDYLQGLGYSCKMKGGN